MSVLHVTGVSGSAKSAVAAALVTRSFAAIGADDDPRLAMWVDASRTRVAEPEKVEGWMSRHWWVWNPRRLDELIAEAPRPVFVCGNAANENGLRDRFDQQVLLVVDEDTMLERLVSTSRANEYGSTVDERSKLQRFRPEYQQRKLAAGAIPIDANRPIGEVVDNMVSMVSATIAGS